jgi:hypothetical protein
MPATDPRWKAAFAEIGELVILYTALDHQLNHIIIEVLNLAKSTMLETVVATLDPRQKVEMLKERAKHIRGVEWRKATQTHADRVERVAKVRNAVCHTVLIRKGDGFEFAPAAAAKLLKSINPQSSATFERLSLGAVTDAIALGEKALGGGENLISNFVKLNARLQDRSSRGVQG